MFSRGVNSNMARIRARHWAAYFRNVCEFSSSWVNTVGPKRVSCIVRGIKESVCRVNSHAVNSRARRICIVLLHSGNYPIGINGHDTSTVRSAPKWTAVDGIWWLRSCNHEYRPGTLAVTTYCDIGVIDYVRSTIQSIADVSGGYIPRCSIEILLVMLPNKKD